MEQASPQRSPAQKSQDATYNSFTHIIDKGIYNFLIGLAVTVAIILSIGLSLLGGNPHSCLPLVFLLKCLAFKATMKKFPDTVLEIVSEELGEGKKISECTDEDITQLKNIYNKLSTFCSNQNITVE